MGPQRPEHPTSQLSNAEFAALVLLLGAGIIATALLISWAFHQADLLAPEVPERQAPTFDPDYQAPPDGG